MPTAETTAIPADDQRLLPARDSAGCLERMWEFYLAYCDAGFRVGSIDVVQFRLTHA